MKEFENLLTEEEVKNLREYEKKNYEYEKIRSHCTHIDHSTKKDSLVLDPKTGIVTCYICGASFKLVSTDISEREIAVKTQDIINIIQTIKIISEGSELDENNKEAWKLIKLYEAIAILKELPSIFVSINRQHNINNPQNFNMKGFMPSMEAFNKVFNSDYATAMKNQFNGGFPIFGKVNTDALRDKPDMTMDELEEACSTSDNK